MGAITASSSTISGILYAGAASVGRALSASSSSLLER